MTRTIAIVPMRHSSERVKGKNYRPLAGAPLYRWVVQTLLEVPAIDRVVIDTDSPAIFEDAAAAFPEVQLVSRPEHLRDGDIPMNDVLLNTLTQVDADVVLQTHSTNPFLEAATVAAALDVFSNRGDDFDSVFSVTRLQARLWTEDVKPVNHDPAVLIRTQDLPPLFIENSSFFVFTPDVLRAHGTRIGPKPRMFEMSQVEAIDIDTENDWDLAAAIAESRVSRR